MMEKVVLAFSGGLDTSYCLIYLIEKGYDVYTVFVNTGGCNESEAERIKNRAILLGAKDHYNINAEEIFFDQIVTYIIKFNSLYENDYPLLCSDRYIIAGEIAKLADKLGTNNVAHGCTNIGNDQVRFDSALSFLNNSINIIKPIKELNITREEEIEYLTNKGISIESKYSKYSINENILGCTISGSEIDEHFEPSASAYQLSNPFKPESPAYITIEFENGVPVKLDSEPMTGAEILKALNIIGGKYSVGKEIYSGDCIIGIKGRILFEAPGIFILMKAWKKVSQYTSTKKQLSFFNRCSEEWSDLVYSGLYYEPLCRNLECIIDEAFKGISSKVKIKLDSNSIEVVEVGTSHSMFKNSIAVYAQKSNWTNRITDGFIQLYSLQQNIAGSR